MAKQHEEINTGEWLNTYADMVTLILTFFVLLFAMSSMSEQKYMEIVKAFTKNPDVIKQIEMLEVGDAEGAIPPMLSTAELGGATGQVEISDNLEAVYKHLKNYSELNDIESSVDIVRGKGYIFLRFKDNLFFEPDSAYLLPGGRELLSFIGDAILEVEDSLELIRIDGHTADVPDAFQSAVSDRVLSTDRANAVLMYFEDVKGITSSKLMAVGHGKWKPVSPNDSEENRQNRRVELYITETDNSSDVLGEIYRSMDEPAG